MFQDEKTELKKENETYDSIIQKEIISNENTNKDIKLTSDENIEDSVLSELSLKQALNKLDDTDREIILLRYINDVPVNVIGKLYDMSRFAVNRRIKRILELLHNDLGKEELV